LHDAEAVLADLGSPLKRIAERRRSEERRLLLQLYEKHGSYSGVARELGITRNAAKYRLLKHSLLNGLRRRDK
jgi:transcriptional regulator with AAA-type ATPase domain